MFREKRNLTGGNFLSIILVSSFLMLLAVGMTSTVFSASSRMYMPDLKGVVSVHDPMIIKDSGSYYLFGSHLASAKSQDLIDWKPMSGGFSTDNPIIKGNPKEELKEALQWPEPKNAETTWAKSPIKIENKYYLYFSASTWGATRSAIGLTSSDNIEGPYEYEGIVLKSYKEGEINREGVKNDPGEHPNAIDPHVFYDKEGELWMSYGSYAGGIYMLKIDSETGMPADNDSYGKRVAGGDNAALEGSYVFYHPRTEYYYFMISFGTLDADGGYNIRVARSKNPDGPFIDPAGDDLVNARPSIGEDHNKYGARLIGNFWFKKSEIGYLSPGHNSALYDKELDKSFVVMHSRFPGNGEMHLVRVHQVLINEQGWPLIMPHSYNGETQAESYSREEITGNYQFINHGDSVNSKVNLSKEISLSNFGEITGAVEGSWELKNGNDIVLNINGSQYIGELLIQYDSGLDREVMTFSAFSDEGITVWGSQY